MSLQHYYCKVNQSCTKIVNYKNDRNKFSIKKLKSKIVCNRIQNQAFERKSNENTSFR